ncbi:MAG TPA: hypothetical protein VMK12_24895 [Anaeromyxobacteraceae bacterium]|nr:hypothetical protein [Anaeromyxobacteraceae bacterium]
MADRETWAKRVAEWRSSGLSARAYCEGKDFTQGGLRYWAYSLEGRPRTRGIRIARVVRVKGLRLSEGKGPEAVLVLEVGSARIGIGPGFDRETLAGILEVLGVSARDR